jgi:hypothetical protein
MNCVAPADRSFWGNRGGSGATGTTKGELISHGQANQMSHQDLSLKSKPITSTKSSSSTKSTSNPQCLISGKLR